MFWRKIKIHLSILLQVYVYAMNSYKLYDPGIKYSNHSRAITVNEQASKQIDISFSRFELQVLTVCES